MLEVVPLKRTLKACELVQRLRRGEVNLLFHGDPRKELSTLFRICFVRLLAYVFSHTARLASMRHGAADGVGGVVGDDQIDVCSEFRDRIVARSF